MSDIVYDIGIDSANLKKELKNTQKKVNNFGKTSAAAFGSAAAGVGLFAGALVTASGAMSKLVSETGQLETATVKWEQLLGGASAADKKIKEVFEFSNKTPYTFKGVNEATQTLYNLSNGALSSMEDITMLGDAAAKGGRPIEELAVTYGRLYQKFEQGDKAFAEEINRFNELGVITGDTKKELQSMDSQLLQQKGWETFIKGMEGAKGTMEKLSTTIEGKISTLSGVWDGVFAFEDKEVQEGIKDSLDLMIDTLNDKKPEIQSILKDTFGVVSKILTGAMVTALDLYKKFTPEIEQAKDLEFKAIAEAHQLKMKFSKKELENQLANQKILQSQDIYTLKKMGLSKAQVPYAESGKEKMEVQQTIIKSLENNDLVKVLEILDEESHLLNNSFGDYTKQLLEANIKPIALTKAIEELNEEGKIPPTKDDDNKIITSVGETKKQNVDLVEVARQEARDRIDREESDKAYYAQLDQEARDRDAMLNEEIWEITLLNYQKEEEKRQDEAAARDNFYSETENIISESEQGIYAIHQIWAKESVAEMTKGMGNLASTTKSILSSVGGLTGAGAGDLLGEGSGLIGGLGIVGTALGAVGGLIDFFSDDEDEAPEPVLARSSAATGRANIVSQGVETVNQYINVSLNAGYIGGEVATIQFIEQQVAPVLADAAKSNF